jgi:thiol:disulfide interchange protein
MNRLAQETSPYLLQHADNPVDWHPWGEEALDRARDEGKPLLVSIGYSSCHWCHVMERESFADEAAMVARESAERLVAELLQELGRPLDVRERERDRARVQCAHAANLLDS